MVKEIWKTVDWKDNFYEISNHGRLRSWKNRKGNKLKEPRIKKQWDNQGYKRIDLSHNGSTKNFLVHRLVAQTFIPNPLGYKQVNHKDGDKTNNHVSNLHWCDNKYNAIHAAQNNLSPNQILTVEDVKVIKFFLQYGKFSQKDLSVVFNVSRKTIGDINTNSTWSHIHEIATIEEAEEWVRKHK